MQTTNTIQLAIRAKNELGLSYVLRKTYTKALCAGTGAIYRHILRMECKNQNPGPNPDSKPLQYAFALTALSYSQSQDVLDVGAGLSAWPALLGPCGYHVTAVDELTAYYGHKVWNRHFHVQRDDITDSKLTEHFGIITCLYTLQHILKHRQALQTMARLLKPSGILVATFPYNENKYVRNAYDLPGSGYGKDRPYICQIYNRATINDWMLDTGLKLIDQRYYRLFSGEFWSTGVHLRPPQEVTVEQHHHMSGIVLQSTTTKPTKQAAGPSYTTSE
jgi:SAM-dependent methyltransferase